MSRLAVPLIGRTVWQTGDELLRAELEFLLRDTNNVLRLVTFRVDSATEMTTMPAVEARRLDLPMPRQPVPGLAHSPTGLPIRAAVIRAQIVGMDGTEYIFPCYFLGDPNAPVPPGPTANMPRNLLGLTGVVDKVRIAFDGRPAPGAPLGVVIVEKQ